MLFAVFDEGNYPVEWCWTLNSAWSMARALAVVYAQLNFHSASQALYSPRRAMCSWCSTAIPSVPLGGARELADSPALLALLPSHRLKRWGVMPCHMQ